LQKKDTRKKMVKRKRKGSKRNSKSNSLFSLGKIIRGVVAIALIAYIFGVLPTYTREISQLFETPVAKIVFVVAVLIVGYCDITLGVLLATAFIVTFITSSRYKSSSVGQLVSDIQSDAQKVTQSAVNTVGDVAQSVENTLTGQNNNQENMDGYGGYHLPTVQKSFEMAEREGQKYLGVGTNCTTIPPPTSGCNPIVGYNAPYNCVCNEGCVTPNCDKNRGCLCQGVETWEGELNAQGLNYPMGNPGPQNGSPF
jgi:hypothetical protein